MIRISVLYPQRVGARFDVDYYSARHMDLVKERFASFGLRGVTVERGLKGGRPRSEAPFRCIAHLTFDRFEDYKAAFQTHGAELLADLPNFTDIEPVIQISEVVL